VVFCSHHHHHLSRETSTAGHRPPPKVLHDERSCAALIQRLPTTFTRSSVHLVEGLPTLRLPVRGCHSRTFCGVQDKIKESHLSLSSMDVVKETKGLIAFTPEIDCHHAMLPVTSAVWYPLGYTLITYLP
jgi:hypothetical protein